jgi:uncharacterized protein YbbC (DUF1343 family)
LTQTITGLEVFVNNDSQVQSLAQGRVALLCHSASVDRNFTLSLIHLKKILGQRLIKIFGPQHGFVTDVQDNMIETGDYIHPYFKIPVHSLYGETRIPTDQMLKDIDTLIVDLQDIGTRVYTYITTLALTMEACAKKGIRVIVFDRPNPIGGEWIEGNILEPEWRSFVGHHPIPMRHGMTMGEIGLLQKKLYTPDSDYHVVTMKNWKRSFFWDETGLPWVNPSPNLATMDSAYTFPGTVLFEGTNISEGRGTTRSLEILGAPGIEPFALLDSIETELKEWDFQGVTLRAANFFPMFQKHAQTACGGFQIHVTNPKQFASWRFGLFMLKTFYKQTEFKFKWNDMPYEYQFKNLAIDYINGSQKIRQWVEDNGDLEQLNQIVSIKENQFKDLREDCLLYK